MKLWIRYLALIVIVALAPRPAFSQQPTVKANVDEVVLDLIVRDKKGKPITDLKSDDLTVTDNGAKQKLSSFRLVRGSEALSQTGAATKLDPMRQLRLVTLAFETMNEADQRKLARSAAIDLIKGDQGTNVYYSVVVISTRLLVLQQFTNDRDALTKAINQATTGLATGKFISESDQIVAELKRNLNGATVNGSAQDTDVIAASTQVAGANTSNGPPTDPTQAALASIMLNMLRFDAGVVSQGTRLSLSALKALVHGLQAMPGRKSVLYFTQGMYLPSELEVMFANLTSMANRANVTFYSVDTRGVMIGAQNAGATAQLSGAANASANTINRNGGATTQDEVLASDNAENSGRANTQLPIRDLAEATGGFLIGDSNDLRGPLHHVNEEISSYYEVTFSPDIPKYDGSFRKLKVDVDRKDAVVHARNGYFALPVEARVEGLQTFEMPLLKAISDGKLSDDVPFRAAAVMLQPKGQGTDTSVLVEVPLRGLQKKINETRTIQSVHCTIGALVKNSKGEVVDKLTRDRTFPVTDDQLKKGNFLEKMELNAPPGKYTLESAVMDAESGKVGFQRAEFTVEPKAPGVAISSIVQMRSYTPNAKGLDANEPFQFQGGSITPTLSPVVPKTADSMLRLFFTIYQDPAIAAKATVEMEFLQNGKSLQKAPLPLPAADAQGRIPYVMTIAASAIPVGNYEVRAIAKQGDTSASNQISIKIEAM
jgi:VWFA-related protein